MWGSMVAITGVGARSPRRGGIAQALSTQGANRRSRAV